MENNGWPVDPHHKVTGKGFPCQDVFRQYAGSIRDRNIHISTQFFPETICLISYHWLGHLGQFLDHGEVRYFFFRNLARLSLLKLWAQFFGAQNPIWRWAVILKITSQQLLHMIYGELRCSTGWPSKPCDLRFVGYLGSNKSFFMLFWWLDIQIQDGRHLQNGGVKRLTLFHRSHEICQTNKGYLYPKQKTSKRTGVI